MSTQPLAPNPSESSAIHAHQTSADTSPEKPVVAAPARLPWIPIRSLAPSHRPRILSHLQSLSGPDRYLRFGFQADDAQLTRYVDGLDFDRDEIFGVFNRRLELVALAHLAYAPSTDTGPTGNAAEFGVSVIGRVRGRGYGARLFEHAMLHARNRGYGTIYIHALSENTPMLRIARHAGATVHRDGPESEAYLKLPPETLASRMEQVIGQGAAAMDYGFKQQALVVDAVVDVITEVRSGILGSASSNRE
ncbi:MAG: GNAT family N-acetyltransferase [Ideonella sp.]|jgi:GNAT superfamily N-acetyltransferase|nr:GNAT family N-acetyltransferase [Ideonella sp.]MBL0150854.1 GNAT family N-acetyltransferase [Ideonella sp.]